jgi:hypothetical protein
VFDVFLRLVRRQPRLPAERRPALDSDERVLAWAAVASPGPAVASADPAAEAGTGGAGTVVATNRGLWLPGEPGRLGWHEIHKAVWSGRELIVTPAEIVDQCEGYAVVADRPPRSYLLLDPGDVPHQVRARVTNSVAYTQHHRTAAGGLRVAGRRVSGRDGLTWTVRFDPDTDGGTDAARAAAEGFVAAARATADPTL